MLLATKQPTIEILGLKVMEPMASLTDILVAAVCFYAFIKLKQLNKEGKVHTYMRWYFLIMGIATFLGGTLGHGFQYAVGLPWKLPGWLISMLSIMCIERASIMHSQPVVNKKFGRFLEVANVVELLVFAVITFTTLNFFFIQVHSAYGLGLIVFPLHSYVYWKTRHEGSRILSLSVLFSSLSAITYTTQFSPHLWFNYIDLSHTIMAISAYFFYLGARNLEVLKPSDIQRKPGSVGKTIKEAVST